jgi:phasin family protein
MAKKPVKSAAKKAVKAAPKPAAKKPAAKPAAKPVLKNATKVSPAYGAFEKVEAVLKSFQPKLDTASVEQTLNQVQEQMEKYGFNMFKGYEGFAQSGKEGVEAAVKSTQLWAKGAEQVGKAISSMTQANFEAGVQASQALLGVKTIKDVMEIQSEFAKSSFDQLISSTSKISDMAMKVANEAMEPISKHINEAIEKAGKAA